MNEYRVAKGIKSKGRSKKGRRATKDCGDDEENYDGNSKEDYMKCICGAYTHKNEIAQPIDDIVRENHPSIFSDVKDILDSKDGLVRKISNSCVFLHIHTDC